jgi:hypothetical protein
MVEAVSGALRRLPLLLVLAAFPSAAFAHRLDEYLQATIVDIEPGGLRLRINLTPGAAVAEPVIALIDRDRDDAISADEVAAYARSLRHDLTVRVDQQDVELAVAASDAAAPVDLRTGSGMIRLEFSGAFGPLAAGHHSVTLENRHLASISVYLVNAAAPRSGSLQIIRQIRNENQSVGEIQFVVERSARSSGGIGMGASLAAVVAAFAGLWWTRKRGATPA